jgi:hypothetical protein
VFIAEKRTSDDLDLRDAMAVSQDNADLRRGGALASQLADVVDDGLGSALEPGGHAARVGDGRGRDALAFAVKTTHVWRWCWAVCCVEGRGRRVSMSFAGAVLERCGNRNCAPRFLNLPSRQACLGLAWNGFGDDFSGGRSSSSRSSGCFTTDADIDELADYVVWQNSFRKAHAELFAPTMSPALHTAL